ncbi:metallophosphoesterase [Pseudomonas syringae]|uniref:metallophosphoesterase n=1 Tax=Pseudomonas syringae TaxID=317 RepID=UPI00352F0566
MGFVARIRSIAVGDLTDRGPGVLDGLKLLGEPWFFCVRGNHEQMLIDAYEQTPQTPYSAHGARWFLTIADESKPMIIQRLASLPIAIGIEAPQGLVGVVHADYSMESLGSLSPMAWRAGIS